MNVKYAFEPGSIRVLDLLGIDFPNPTRWDRDTASELCKMVRDAHIRLSLLLLRTICANGVMGKKKQNKLAALLVNIPDERFLVVRQPFLDARESADLYNY
jgi:hypothetical protein